MIRSLMRKLRRWALPTQWNEFYDSPHGEKMVQAYRSGWFSSRGKPWGYARKADRPGL